MAFNGIPPAVDMGGAFPMIGKTLGPYEITSLLGRVGRREVYGR